MANLYVLKEEEQILASCFASNTDEAEKILLEDISVLLAKETGKSLYESRVYIWNEYQFESLNIQRLSNIRS